MNLMKLTNPKYYTNNPITINLFFRETVRTTLDRLLKVSLPAKYAITGHIDEDEKLPNGFYDPGFLRKEEPFIPLESMSYLTRNPTQRVIYLNLSTEVDSVVFANNVCLGIQCRFQFLFVISQPSMLIHSLCPENPETSD